MPELPEVETIRNGMEKLGKESFKPDFSAEYLTAKLGKRRNRSA